MGNNRDINIDLMKGIGIILMIYGHSHFIPIIGKWIYTFHMPLFFFLSGCFFKSQYDIKKNVKRIILPYFPFALIMCSIILFVSFAISEINHLNSLSELFKKIIYFKSNLITAIKGEEKSLFFKTLWFLPVLFVVQTLYYFIHTKFNKYIHLICIIFLFVSIFLFYRNIDLPYFIDTIFLTIPYYHCGRIFYMYKEKFKKINSIYLFSLILIPLIIIFIKRYNVDYKYNIVPWYNHILSLMTIIGFYLILSKANFGINFIVKIGNLSIFYFGLHRSFFLIYTPILNKLIKNIYLQSIILSIITIISIYILLRILGKRKKFLLWNFQ